jgi:hypothetical protein
MRTARTTNAKGDRTGRGAHRASAAPRPKPVPDGEAAHLKVPYVPTEQERAAVDGFLERRRQRIPAPILKQTETKAITVDHPDAKVGGTLAITALGLADGETFTALTNQIMNAASKGKDVDISASNEMLAMIRALEPRDTLEAMLATQMAAVHYATMTFARKLNHVENIPQQDSASNAFTKLTRTFAAQVEALNRYRGKGQQQVTVTHMHVHDGGQAIVAGSVQGGGAKEESGEQPHAKQVTYAPVTTLPSKEAERRIMPEPCYQR